MKKLRAVTLLIFALSGVLSGQTIKTKIVATDLDIPWALAFAPDGRLFFSERGTGEVSRLRVISAGGNLQQMPMYEVRYGFANGQTDQVTLGLRGVAVDPYFAYNNYLYVNENYKDAIGVVFNRIVRLVVGRDVAGNDIATLDRVLIDRIPAAIALEGGGIKVGPDGMLYVSAGNTEHNKDNRGLEAQNVNSLAGKILRIDRDGNPAAGNPFYSSANARYVYSYGHRNVQGLAWDSAGQLYATEHGPSSPLYPKPQYCGRQCIEQDPGYCQRPENYDPNRSAHENRCIQYPPAHDEVNRIHPGGNYGWPCYIGLDKFIPNQDQPVCSNLNLSTTDLVRLFAPEIAAPGGATFYYGDALWAWRGSLLFGTLAGQHLHRLSFGTSPPDEALYNNRFGRLRDVVEGPSGTLYLTTSNNVRNDRIIQVSSQTPFGGTARTLPGVIQAEDFDDGGQHVAYYDVEDYNKFGSYYRQTGVDVFPSGSGHVLGWVVAGEWLEYTVNVPLSGMYDVEAMVGSPAPGGGFHVEFRKADTGANADPGIVTVNTGSIPVPATGGYNVFQPVSARVHLFAGEYRMRAVIDSNNAEGVAVGDFDYFRVTQAASVVSTATGADNLPRVLWRLQNGAAHIWTLSADGTTRVSSVTHGPFAGWSPRAISVGADNIPNLLWTNTDGSIGLWRLNADNTHNDHRDYGPFAGWKAVALAGSSDGRPRVLWEHADGTTHLWRVNHDWTYTYASHGPFGGWHPVNAVVGYDNRPRILWRHENGQMAVWNCNPDGSHAANREHGPFNGWAGRVIAVGRDNLAHVLWNNFDGRIGLWSVNWAGDHAGHHDYGPYGGWTAVAMGNGGDSLTRIAWQHTSGTLSVWTVNPDNTHRSTTDYAAP
jgi:glucose/arabinose dehydrogenase